MKWTFCSITGIAGSLIATALGGWDSGMITLIIFMAIDYISGLAVAGIFHTSKKTKTGGLESNACWKGLIKKVMTLLIVVIATMLDRMIATNYIRDYVIIAFVTSELISVIENAGLMGIPIPKPIINAVDILKQREEKE